MHLQRFVMRHSNFSSLQPVDISGLADIGDSIRAIDLGHINHVIVQRPLAGLAMRPLLEHFILKHCQPTIINGSQRDYIRMLAMPTFLTCWLIETPHTQAWVGLLGT